MTDCEIAVKQTEKAVYAKLLAEVYELKYVHKVTDEFVIDSLIERLENLIK